MFRPRASSTSALPHRLDTVGSRVAERSGGVGGRGGGMHRDGMGWDGEGGGGGEEEKRRGREKLDKFPRSFGSRSIKTSYFFTGPQF